MPEPFRIESLDLSPVPEVYALLKQCPDIEPQRFRDEEYLIHQDEESQDIFVVLDGAFVVEQLKGPLSARPSALACITCDPSNIAIVGEMAMLGNQVRAASVRSSGSTHALCLRPAHMDVIIDGFPALTRVICRQLSRRLREANNALRELQERFAMHPKHRRVRPGELLFSKGDVAGELLQLLSGSIALERDGLVNVVTFDDLHTGFLEPDAYFRSRKHQVTARAETPSLLVAIGEEDREAVTRCFPEFVLSMLEA